MGILSHLSRAQKAYEKEVERAAKEKQFHERLVAILSEHAPTFHDEYRIQWLSSVSGRVVDTFHKFRDVDAALDYIDVDYGGFLERNITWVETRRVPEWRPL